MSDKTLFQLLVIIFLTCVGFSFTTLFFIVWGCVSFCWVMAGGMLTIHDNNKLKKEISPQQQPRKAPQQ